MGKPDPASDSTLTCQKTFSRHDEGLDRPGSLHGRWSVRGDLPRRVLRTGRRPLLRQGRGQPLRKPDALRRQGQRCRRCRPGPRARRPPRQCHRGRRGVPRRVHLHRSRLTPGPDAPSGAATASSATAAIRRARQYLSDLALAAVDRVFFEPLDVANEAEALALLADREDGSRLRAAMLGASEWALARFARRTLLPRLGTKVAVWTGGKTAGKVILPITLSIEVTLAARDGVRELQVLASFLMSRLRAAGLPVQQRLVRRTTTSLYLYPSR